MSSAFASSIFARICLISGLSLLDAEKNPMLFSYVVMFCCRALYLAMRMSLGLRFWELPWRPVLWWLNRGNFSCMASRNPARMLSFSLKGTWPIACQRSLNSRIISAFAVSSSPGTYALISSMSFLFALRLP